VCFGDSRRNAARLHHRHRGARARLSERLELGVGEEGAAGGGFPEFQAREEIGGEGAEELFGHPIEQVLGGGQAADDVVEVVVIEPVDNPLSHEALDMLEVHNHAGLRIDRAAQGDDQPIGMAVQAGAIAEDGVILGIAPVLAAELVARLEPELAGNLGDGMEVTRVEICHRLD